MDVVVTGRKFISMEGYEVAGSKRWDGQDGAGAAGMQPARVRKVNERKS
jgi:hypothetical protein